MAECGVGVDRKRENGGRNACFYNEVWDAVKERCLIIIELILSLQCHLPNNM